MKKVLLAFAILGFVACNNEGETTNAADTTATPAVDTTAAPAVDTTVKVDTTVAPAADTTKK
jgi:hypothetical protein